MKRKSQYLYHILYLILFRIKVQAFIVIKVTIFMLLWDRDSGEQWPRFPSWFGELAEVFSLQ